MISGFSKKQVDTYLVIYFFYGYLNCADAAGWVSVRKVFSARLPTWRFSQINFLFPWIHLFETLIYPARNHSNMDPHKPQLNQTANQ